MNDIKNCPFWGNAPIIESGTGNIKQRCAILSYNQIEIECKVCSFSRCFRDVRLSCDETLAMALKWWNTRSGQIISDREKERGGLTDEELQEFSSSIAEQELKIHIDALNSQLEFLRHKYDKSDSDDERKSIECECFLVIDRIKKIQDLILKGEI